MPTADRIEVTGQPRFDIYASTPGRADRRRAGACSFSRTRSTRTFPEPAGARDCAPGSHCATRPRLRSSSRCAPGRARSSSSAIRSRIGAPRRRAWRAVAGAAWRPRRDALPAEDADTRELILAADVVVGFQTTALYEAVAARRTRHLRGVGRGVRAIPRRAHPVRRRARPAASVMRPRAESLVTMITDGTAANGSALPRVVRGGARTARRPRNRACGTSSRNAGGGAGARLSDAAISTRAGAGSRSGYLARSVAAEAVWTVAVPAAVVAGEQRRVGVRRKRAREGRATAIATLRNGDAAANP